MTQVIMLNGGSSSGKTGIARCLQAILPRPWIRLGVDDLVAALPPSLLDRGQIARGDRVAGMAASQATIVHKDVTYDVEVGTARFESLDCARTAAAYIT
jgi:chloramphenicol 3-O-phosphotransferase